MPKIKFEIARDLSSDNIEETNQQTSDQPKNIEWDDHKENIQPLTKGRKIEDLLNALQIIDSTKTRKELISKRKAQFDEELANAGNDLDKQLTIWHEYIDWLEQNVPDGGKVNNITNAIEECIEIYYDKKKFKQDKRLFDIFMKFKQFCHEPIEVYGFMYANSICVLLARFYLNWSWQYEIRRNMKQAEDLIKIGLKNLATPRELLLEAERQIKVRIERMIRSGELLDSPDLTAVSSRDSQRQLAEGGIRAALQTLKFKTNKKRGPNGATTGGTVGVNGTLNGACIVPINRVGNAVDTVNVGGLKSQTKLVNGVPVAKNKRSSTGPKAGGLGGAGRKCNKPIQIYSDLENVPENNDENNVGGSVGGRVLSQMMTKIPTSQQINNVGQLGKENQAQRSGALRNA